MNSKNTRNIAFAGLLTAIIIVMSFTPLGYLKVGAISITFLAIPVALGAILMGPGWGALFGAIFGATSFAQCFGLEPFGTALLAVNPFFTFLLCMVPRVLIGVVVGLFHRALSRAWSREIPVYILSALLGALSNTVFFIAALLLLFGNSEPIRALGETTFQVIAVLVTANALWEALACAILCTPLAKILFPLLKRRHFSA